MATLTEEKKASETTFTALNDKQRTQSNAYRDVERMSFAEKSMMKHRGHTTLTELPHVPAKFMFHAKATAFRRVRSQSIKPDGSFTPRVTIDGSETDPIMDTNDNHYTPDWFKISIRTVDRDTIQDTDEETKMVTQKIQEICQLRDKYLYKPTKSDHIGCTLSDGYISIDVQSQLKKFPKSIADQFECKFEKGIMRITSKKSKREIFEFPSFAEYQLDLQSVMDLVSFGPAKTMCYRRLKILHSRFILHQWLNDHVEVLEVKSIPHRDFYNVRKIDNHVHHSACMHQKHLLRFIKAKLKKEGDTICFKTKAGKKQSLREVFEDIGMTGHELSIDALDMHAHQETFQRFDKFNAKYNPIGKAQLRTIFLKIDNLIKGRYLAEITREVAIDLEESRYQFAEYRLSIYGKKKEEWDIMGDWICNNNLYSSNVRWLIQMPRIYNVFRKIGLPTIKCFNDMMDNFFTPLFQVTIDPSTHPSLHLFLQMVVGFDSVDDESSPEQKRRKYPDPSQWKHKDNPPYIYYAYYIWINICKLNRLREERGMNVFAFRPHCGEAGDFDHLGCSFLLAHSINHGIRLKHAPVLQYLYYLKQIGLAMSPLSNNILFTEYDNNPLPSFFKRGLNVSLSTDDPLLIHYTKDALLEEYSIAAQVYNLSSIDLCELARNSVLQSGFDHSFKQHCIGKTYNLRGAEGNNIYQSNVPDARLEYRNSILQEEENFISYVGYPTELMRKKSLANLVYVGHNNEQSEQLSGFPDVKIIKMNTNYNTTPDATPNTQIHDTAVSSDYRNTGVFSKNKMQNLAETIALDKNMDINKPPPHEEWISLANEKQRLQIIRDALLKFVNQNKQSGNTLHGFTELEEQITQHLLPQLIQSDTSNDNLIIQKKQSIAVSPGDDEKQLSLSPVNSKQSSLSEMAKSNNSKSPKMKSMKKQNSNDNNYKLEKQKKKKLSNDSKEGYIINDIRGKYFDDNDNINEIDNKFNIKLSETNIEFNMKPNKNKKKNIMELKCDLITSKQEHILEDDLINQLLIISDGDNSNSESIKCEMPDPKTGELIWNPSGVVWFKKEWKLLVGAWNDQENNLIEIRSDNTLRYIDGYGPFHGEFIGFQKFHVAMPNGLFMIGHLMSYKEIKWQNGEKWIRMSDKGCLIM